MTRHKLPIRLTGVSFVAGYPDSLLRLNDACDEAQPEGLGAVLERRPDNKFDANAIAVMVPALGQIGWIPAHSAAWMAPEIDEGKRYNVNVTAVYIAEGHEDRPGVEVKLWLASP